MGEDCKTRSGAVGIFDQENATQLALDALDNAQRVENYEPALTTDVSSTSGEQEVGSPVTRRIKFRKIED